MTMLWAAGTDGGRDGGLGDDEVAVLLRAAAAAPSSHDTQPWRLRWSARAVEIHGDPARALAVSDPDHRELRIACGAAAANVRIALRAAGHHAHTRLLPHPGDPWFLALVRPGAARVCSAADVALARAIHDRRTDRHAFTGAPVPVHLRGLLTRVAYRERCWVVFLDAGERRGLREMTAAAHRAQAADPAFRQEWARWSDVGPRVTTDRDRVGPVVEEEPAVAVLSTFSDSPVAQLQAGQALGHVLLGATVAGVSASFVAPLLEVAEVRREVRALLGGALWPQVVLRFGYGHPATPRRAAPEEDTATS